MLLVKKVYGEIIRRELYYSGTRFSVLDTRITCVLEDNRSFYLERVPPEIIFSLNRIEGKELEDDRERFVDILLSIPEIIDILGRYLKRVVIDKFDEKTGVYSATVEFADGNITLRRKMVPSHAIFLARLTKKPIYVKKELVEYQESIYKLIEDIEEIELFDEDIEDYRDPDKEERDRDL